MRKSVQTVQEEEVNTASSSWGIWVRRRALVPGPEGLARMRGSDGEAWGLVSSPLCVSARVRDEKRRQPRSRRGHCALKTVDRSGWCKGGVSPRGSS